MSQLTVSPSLKPQIASFVVYDANLGITANATSAYLSNQFRNLCKTSNVSQFIAEVYPRNDIENIGKKNETESAMNGFQDLVRILFSSIYRRHF